MPVSLTRELQNAVAHRRIDRDDAAGFGELHGIADEIDQDLLDGALVGDDLIELALDAARQRDALGLGLQSSIASQDLTEAPISKASSISS